MKQLTIYCGEELNDTITHLLHEHGVDSFIHVPGIYGTTVKPKGSYEKDMAWQASAFIVFTEGKILTGIMNDLQAYSHQCKVRPCLRVTVTAVEELY